MKNFKMAAMAVILDIRTGLFYQFKVSLLSRYLPISFGSCVLCCLKNSKWLSKLSSNIQNLRGGGGGGGKNPTQVNQ